MKNYDLINDRAFLLALKDKTQYLITAKNNQNHWQDPEKTPGLIIPVLELSKLAKKCQIFENYRIIIIFNFNQDSSGQSQFSFLSPIRQFLNLYLTLFLTCSRCIRGDKKFACGYGVQLFVSKFFLRKKSFPKTMFLRCQIESNLRSRAQGFKEKKWW